MHTNRATCETVAADPRKLLHRDVREMELARAAANRAAARLAALPADATLAVVTRAADRLGRAARRLETAIAWVGESRGDVARSTRA